jgi:hypothetical protein
MDKQKVITAYRRGFITIQECAQILGMDSLQILAMANDPKKRNRLIICVNSRSINIRDKRQSFAHANSGAFVLFPRYKDGLISCQTGRPIL